jgi:hypothetical protein
MIIATLTLALLASKPLVLAHYMPWFEAPPVGNSWGWHWTMGATDPEEEVGGKRHIASHYYPAIGPYDSGDPDVLEYHALLMKAAGIDGIVIDWYGRKDVYDYAQIHRNTERIIGLAEKVGLKFAICWEDQTVPNLVKFGKVQPGEEAIYGRSELDWMTKTWFTKRNYVKAFGKPLLLVFGPQFFKEKAWHEILKGHSLTIVGVSGPHMFKNGGFGWPNAKDPGLANFYHQARSSSQFLACAYPRFHDFYSEAKLHESYGQIPDESGLTFERLLAAARSSGSPIIQLATWNDWGEGTQIEPSQEFGTRDLEKLNPSGKKRFDLIAELFRARKAKSPFAERAAGALRSGNDALASKLLRRP